MFRVAGYLPLLGLLAVCLPDLRREPFMVRDDAPSLRVTVGNIHHSVMEYAARLADAAGNQPARSGQR